MDNSNTEWIQEYITSNLYQMMAIRGRVFSTRTAYQEVEVVDSLQHGRCLLLDGKTQSAEADEFIYHEGLVHPAMVTQRSPMTTPAGPAFMAKLTKNDHHMAEHVNEIREHIVSDGALSAKVKTLMTLVCDAITAHEDGCRNIANRARALGATEEEIAETVQVAFLFGGMPALVTACAAFKDD